MPVYNFEGFDEIPVGSRPQLDPGVYTMQIDRPPEESVDEKGQTYLTIHYTVIDGPQQETVTPEGGTSPVGREWVDRVYLTPKALWRFKTLLVAAGLLDPKDKTSEKARGMNINTDELVGRTVTVSLEPTRNPNTGREYLNTTFLVP